MKKWTKILLIIVIVILLLFVGMSYFIGTQVFMGSTQLVTCEDTSKVKDSFWEKYNMDYDVFCSTYTIEKVEITSTFDEHMIPADYIYALGEEGDKNNPTVILVHGLGGNRYTNYPFLIVSVYFLVQATELIKVVIGHFIVHSNIWLVQMV